MSKVSGNPFWQWSNDAYEMPGVKNRLIYTQDDFGFDVNLTLWCCWRASEGETLTKAALVEADKAVTEWSDGVIEPLRKARRNAHGGPAELYESIKEAELEAEHREQDILYGLSRPGTPISEGEMLTAARNNLALYASLLDAPRRQGFSTALLRDLIDHIFGVRSAGKD